MMEDQSNEGRLLKEELERRMRMDQERLEYERWLRKREIQRRQFFVISFAIAVTVTFLVSYFIFRSAPESPLFRIIIFGFPIVAIAMVAMIYLQSAPSFKGISNTNENYARLRFYIDERLSDAFSTLKSSKQADIEFSESDKAKVLASIQAKLESDSLQSYVAGIRDLVATRVSEDALEERFQSIVRRLGREVQDLARRGNLNLILGILTTLAGLSVLGYAVFYSPLTQSPEELLAYFFPRVALVILIEVFAYFFLRLYKQSLAEIKYFQNEMTNVESRQLALHVAIRHEDAALRARVVDELSRTERNFILGAGQTTVEIERERLAKGGYLDLSNALKEIIKRKTDG